MGVKKLANFPDYSYVPLTTKKQRNHCTRYIREKNGYNFSKIIWRLLEGTGDGPTIPFTEEKVQNFKENAIELLKEQ